jgi:hypothetical protein
MSPSTSIQLMTDAVIAQYIHEISVRHRPRPARTAGGGGASAASSRRPRLSPKRAARPSTLSETYFGRPFAEPVVAH